MWAGPSSSLLLGHLLQGGLQACHARLDSSRKPVAPLHLASFHSQAHWSISAVFIPCIVKAGSRVSLGKVGVCLFSQGRRAPRAQRAAGRGCP